jgi:hypothetical protein
MREQAILEYHEMLAADETLTAELFARLRSGMSAMHLLYGERPLGVALRPHLLTRQQYDALAYASETLAAAFDKISDALISNPALMENVGMRGLVRDLALVDPGYKCPAVTARLDAFFIGSEIKFVEYNAENPSSLPDQAGLNQLLFETRAMQNLAEHYRIRQFDPVSALLESLLETYHEWGGQGAPNVAILDWKDLPTAHEFILLRNYFASRGVPTVVCEPDELEYEGGTLRRADFCIDLVYKRIIINEILARYDETHPLIRAYVNHDVCLVNSFRCKALHKKAAFEFLTDEECANWFTSAEREVIRRCVPWTRRVCARKTLHKGKEVDLLEYVRRNREAFMLKPNDDYGGRGISFGNRVEQAEWEKMLGLALKEDYIVQEMLDLRTEEFPIFSEHDWGLQQMFVDTNPFIFRGQMHGAMVRLSDSPLVNVTSGGGETGFFVIEGRIGSSD